MNPSVLVVAAKWWPLSARMAAALSRLGCNVSALCPANHPLTHVAGIRDKYRYDGVFSLASLQRALRECRPDIVVPCDDGVVAQLHALHAAEPDLRALIERSLGPSDGYSVIDNRFKLLSAASNFGIRVPRMKKIEAPEDLAAWHRDVAPIAVLKVDGESGGHGVKISRNLVDSLAARRVLRRPCSSLTAWKRLAIDRDVLVVWSRRQKSEREVMAQEFIVGRPANSMLACWQGKLLSIASVAVVASEGPTGAASVVRVIENPEMQKAAQLLASGLNLTGFYGLDFILQSATGAAYLIEMNPRCTQLGHIELADQGSLAGAFTAALRGEVRPQTGNPISQRTIALFPQALAAGEACRPYIDASYHDVPSQDPELMAELLLKSWPHRQWPARLYHVFKPLDRVKPMMFEELNSSAMLSPGLDSKGSRSYNGIDRATPLRRHEGELTARPKSVRTV